MKTGSALLHALFVLSGLSGLGLQIAWARMFATGLGHEMPSVLALIAAIFAGIALGAWSSERFLQSSSQPGHWYGGCEILIGLWAAVSVGLIPWSNRVALSAVGLEPSAWRQWLVTFLIPAFILLPATAAMGASFPAMERLVAPLSRHPAVVAGLYAANTLGAVIGIVISTTESLPAFGFSRTVLVFAGLNLMVGLLALWLVSRFKWSAGQIAATHDQRQGGTRLGLTLLLTGFLGIGYEVLGVRLLAEVLENTIFTYSAVLSVYLLGTAAGAMLYHAAAPKSMAPWQAPRLLLGLAGSCVAGAWILTLAPAVHAALGRGLGKTAFAVWTVEFLTAGTVFLLPTICMGALFSHLLRLAKGHGLGVGKAVGLNTAGCALAPAIFGVMLLPVVGAKWSFALLSLGYLALSWPAKRFDIGLAALTAVLALTLPNNLRLLRPGPGEKLLAYRAGAMDSAAVIEHGDGHRSLIVNGRFTMGGTGAVLPERRHASIPLLLHPAPQRALFLGLGTGITFAAAGAHPGLSADGVELVPEVVELLPWFAPQNSLPEGDGRFRIYVADARRFVRAAPQRYDVIVADLFHPARDGAGALYALEHFQALRDRLAEGGLVCQWLPLFQLDTRMLQVITRTFLEVFPEASAFLLRFNVDTPVLGLISGLQRARFGPEYFADRTANPALRARMQQDQIRDGLQLFGCFVAGPEQLRAFCAGAPLNTDDHPRVVFEAPLFNRAGQEKPYGRLQLLLHSYSAGADVLLPTGPPSLDAFRSDLADFIAARNLYLEGAIAEVEGDRSAAVEAYLASARRSSFFPTAYAQVLTLGAQLLRSDREAGRRLLQRLAAARPDLPVAGQLLQRLEQEPASGLQ